MIKRVSNLTEGQRNMVLTAYPHRTHCKYAGKTIGEMIRDAGIQPDMTIAELYEFFESEGLEWPFRTITITVEVTHSRGYTIGVLVDDDIMAVVRGSSDLEEIAPNFSLETAYDEAYASFVEGQSRYDYSVEDDSGRVLLDWDD